MYFDILYQITRCHARGDYITAVRTSYLKIYSTNVNILYLRIWTRVHPESQHCNHTPQNESLNRQAGRQHRAPYRQRLQWQIDTLLARQSSTAGTTRPNPGRTKVWSVDPVRARETCCLVRPAQPAYTHPSIGFLDPCRSSGQLGSLRINFSLTPPLSPNEF